VFIAAIIGLKGDVVVVECRTAIKVDVVGERRRSFWGEYFNAWVA